MPRNIKQKDFKTTVLGHDKPVAVDIWADWCGPCKMLAPHFAAAEKELEGKARFVKIDSEKNRKISKKYKVMSLPTILYFKDGELVDRSVGVVSRNDIISRLKPLLNEEDKGKSTSGFKWKFWK